MNHCFEKMEKLRNWHRCLAGDTQITQYLPRCQNDVLDRSFQYIAARLLPVFGRKLTSAVWNFWKAGGGRVTSCRILVLTGQLLMVADRMYWWQVFGACSLVHTNGSPARTSWVESPGGTYSFLPDFAPGWSCTAGVRLAVTRVIMCKKLPRNRTRDLYQTLWLYWRCSQLPRRIQMASRTVEEQPYWPRTSCLVFFYERGSGKCAEASSALKSRERCQENVGPVITPHGRADPAEDSSKDAVGLDEQRYDTNTSEFCFSTQNQQDKLTKYQSVLRSKLYGLVGSRR